MWRDDHRERALGGSIATRGAATLFLAVVCLVGATGCGQFVFGEGGSLTAVSQSPDTPASLTNAFDHAIYGHDDKDMLTVILYDGAVDQPTVAAVMRMFYLPEASRTPVDATATNANVHYIIFAGGGEAAREVGVYSGAGFLYPTADPGQAALKLELWEASIQLADRSAGFENLLGQSVLRGSFTAHRDEAKVSRLLHTLNARVNEQLGYPRLVKRPKRLLPGPLASR